MKKKIIKMMSLLLIVVLFTSLFTGCASESEGTEEATDTGASENTDTNEEASNTDDLPLDQYPDVMKVTAYLAGGCNPPVTEDNITVKYILENLKIDLSDVVWPAGEDTLQRINTMAVGGELPDVVQYWTQPEVFFQMADAGLLLPLDDYFEYLPNYFKAQAKEVVDTYRNPKDGKLYMLPSFTVSPSDPEAATKAGNNRTLMLRTDIWEKYGSMSLNTPDDLYNFLKTVKANEKDLIPFGSVTPGFLWELLNIMFVPDYGPYYVKIDDAAQRIYDVYYLPGYLDGLKYFAKLYREGLMDPEILTLTQQQTEEKMKNANYAVYMGYVDTLASLGVQFESQGKGTLDAIQFPFNQGVDPSKRLSYDPLGWSMIGINKNVQDPVRLLKFIDWQNTPNGARTVADGAPSKTDNIWYLEGDKPVFNKEVYEKVQSGEYDLSGVGNWSYWFAIPCTWAPEYASVFLEGGPGNDPRKQHQIELIKPLLFSDLKMAKYSVSAKGPVYQEKNTSVSNLLSNYTAKILMDTANDAEVESLYNEMIAEMEKAGLIDIEKENYQIYKEAEASVQ